MVRPPLRGQTVVAKVALPFPFVHVVLATPPGDTGIVANDRVATLVGDAGGLPTDGRPVASVHAGDKVAVADMPRLLMGLAVGLAVTAPRPTPSQADTVPVVPDAT